MSIESSKFVSADQTAREAGRRAFDHLSTTTTVRGLEKDLMARSISVEILTGEQGFSQVPDLRVLPWRDVDVADVPFVAETENGSYFVGCRDGFFYLPPPEGITDDIQEHIYSRQPLPVLPRDGRSIIVSDTRKSSGETEGPRVVRLYIQKPPEGGRAESFVRTRDLVRTMRNMFVGISQVPRAFDTRPSLRRR